MIKRFKSGELVLILEYTAILNYDLELVRYSEKNELACYVSEAKSDTLNTYPYVAIIENGGLYCVAAHRIKSINEKVS